MHRHPNQTSLGTNFSKKRGYLRIDVRKKNLKKEGIEIKTTHLSNDSPNHLLQQSSSLSFLFLLDRKGHIPRGLSSRLCSVPQVPEVFPSLQFVLPREKEVKKETKIKTSRSQTDSPLPSDSSLA